MIKLESYLQRPTPKLLRRSLEKQGQKIHGEAKLVKVLEGSGLMEKLETLLYVRHHKDANEDLLRYYVDNPADKDIQRFRESTRNVTEVMVGPRGAGKSAAIRKAFGLGLNPAYSEDMDELRIPLYFDNLTDKSKEACFEHIQSVILEAANRILSSFALSKSPSEFISFVKDTKASLLSSDFLSDDFSSSSSDVDSRDALKDRYPVAYSISYLKFVLHQAYQVRKKKLKVIFIADDLESAVDGEVISATVGRLLSSITCLENMGHHEAPAVLLAIVCVRPATYEILSASPAINAHNIPTNPIRLNPIEVDAMFKKRLNENIKDLEGHEPRKQWSISSNVVSNIVTSLQHLNPQFLIGISNYNLRDTCQLIYTVIKNSHWYERVATEDAAAGAFRIKEDDYQLTQAAIVRCLALGEGSIFYSKDDNFLPNIFYSHNSFDAMLMGPYFIKYCLENRGRNGFARLQVSDAIRKMKLLFDADLVDQIFPDIISYFSERGLLRLVHIDGEHLVTQPRMFAIWRHLGSSSVIIENYRDDTSIRHYSLINDSDMLAPSSALGPKTFLGALDFLNSAIELEESIANNAIKNARHNFVPFFGDALVCGRLLSGISNSRNAYYKKRKEHGNLSDAIEVARGKVLKLQRHLQSNGIEVSSGH